MKHPRAVEADPPSDCVDHLHQARPILEQTFRINVNGSAREVRCEADTPLLTVLRNDLGLNGAKFGCGLGQCGSCAVLLDGVEVRACVLPVSAATKGLVVTLEGLGKSGALHPLQKAFVEEQAAQCGYCTSGMIIAAKALLDKQRRPDATAIKKALDGHVCRCGVHNRIVKAVVRASQDLPQ